MIVLQQHSAHLPLLLVCWPPAQPVSACSQTPAGLTAAAQSKSVTSNSNIRFCSGAACMPVTQQLLRAAAAQQMLTVDGLLHNCFGPCLESTAQPRLLPPVAASPHKSTPSQHLKISWLSHSPTQATHQQLLLSLRLLLLQLHARVGPYLVHCCLCVALHVIQTAAQGCQLCMQDRCAGLMRQLLLGLLLLAGPQLCLKGLLAEGQQDMAVSKLPVSPSSAPCVLSGNCCMQLVKSSQTR